MTATPVFILFIAIGFVVVLGVVGLMVLFVVLA